MLRNHAERSGSYGGRGPSRRDLVAGAAALVAGTAKSSVAEACAAVLAELKKTA